MRRYFCAILLGLFLSVLLACSSQPPAQQPNQPNAANQPAPGNQPAGNQPATTSPGTQPASTPHGAAAPAAKGQPATAPAAANAVVPAGEHIVVRLNQAVGSKISNPGDTFTATVAQPVTVGNNVVIPAGASASGTVADAKPLGRFKGGAVLRIVLNSVTVNGKTYNLQTAAVARAAKGKGKRSAVTIGGGAGLGALIGGIAGGGKGAAIGAAAGAGAGTAGAAFTGNKNIVLPAESAVSFRLLQAVEIR